MPEVYRPAPTSELHGLVVVLSGGATGIGAATVRLLHGLGAHVVFGDDNEPAARTLAYELTRQNDEDGDDSAQTVFVRTDAANYDAVKALFEEAWKRFGRVDHAACIAGIKERGDWMEFDGHGGSRLSRDRILQEGTPNTRTLGVNLVGTGYFARVAVAYLNETRSAHRTDAKDHSLTLMSSLNGFVACGTNFTMYTASKHGVLGVARTLHEYLSTGTPSLRVNWLHPSATRTPMTEGLDGPFAEKGLPLNEAEDVARVIGDLIRDDQARGKGLYIESAVAWDIEGALNESRDSWWGKERREIYEKSRQVLDGFV